MRTHRQARPVEGNLDRPVTPGELRLPSAVVGVAFALLAGARRLAWLAAAGTAVAVGTVIAPAAAARAVAAGVLASLSPAVVVARSRSSDADEVAHVGEHLGRHQAAGQR